MPVLVHEGAIYTASLLTQGLPFPTQELNAVDVVVRYAVTKLGFAFEDIVLYAWSIGEASYELCVCVLEIHVRAACLHVCGMVHMDL